MSTPLSASRHALSSVSPSRWRGVSSLKVAWRRDRHLDDMIARDRDWWLCARIVREVLAEPRGVIPLYYLERRRERLGLDVRVKTFLARNPTLFDVYQDRIVKSSSRASPYYPSSTPQPIPFLRPSTRLKQFLAEESRIHAAYEPIALFKLRKLLMMSRDRAILAEKLLDVRRDFGLPHDLLTRFVPSHPDAVRLVAFGDGSDSKRYVELVSWDPDLAKSVVERRADEDAELTGIRMRPNIEVRLPPGMLLRKEMRGWVRDWLELPYISPYADSSGLPPSSRESEKRMIGVFHEMLSLTVLRRSPIPTVAKFGEEFRLSNEVAAAFARHPGIFYVSRKGGIRTALLREAYGPHGVLVDRDPMLEVKDLFVEMMEEGHKIWLEREKERRQANGGEAQTEVIEEDVGEDVESWSSTSD